MNAPKNRRRKAAEPVAVPATPPAAVSLPVEPVPETLAAVASHQPPASRPLPRYQPIVPGEG